jgi:hypothetical protein
VHSTNLADLVPSCNVHVRRTHPSTYTRCTTQSHHQANGGSEPSPARPAQAASHGKPDKVTCRTQWQFKQLNRLIKPARKDGRNATKVSPCARDALQAGSSAMATYLRPPKNGKPGACQCWQQNTIKSLALHEDPSSLIRQERY